MSSPYEFIAFGGPFDAPRKPPSATQASSATGASSATLSSPAVRHSPAAHPSPATDSSVEQSTSSPVPENHWRFYKDIVNGGRGFNLDGQPTDQPGSSNTQSVGNERNSNLSVSGSQQSSEAPALSNGSSIGGQAVSAPQSVSSGTDAPSFDPSLQFLLGTDFSSDMISGAGQTNSTYAGYSSDINVTPRASQLQNQGAPANLNHSNPNEIPWTSPYVVQGDSFGGYPAQDESRAILDDPSIYNSSQSESPTGGSKTQTQSAGIKSNTGSQHGNSVSTLATTAPNIGLHFGVANPVLLPGYNNDYAVNPILDPEYTISDEVRGKLSEIDDRAPEYMPRIMDVYDVANSGADTKTIFADCSAAHKFKDEQILHDDTIPRTLDQQRAIVKMLCSAMKSLEYARDSENMLSPFRRGKFSDARIEKVCWGIVQTCMYTHTKGFLLANYGYRARQSSKIKTYAERMSIIVELLLLRKTICKHLLDPYYVYHVVDDPIHALKRVVSNKNLNNRKGSFMCMGKQEAARLEALAKAEALAKEKGAENGETCAVEDDEETLALLECPEDPMSSPENTDDEGDESEGSSDSVGTSNTKAPIRKRASVKAGHGALNDNGKENSDRDGEYEHDDDYTESHEGNNNDKPKAKNSKASKAKGESHESKAKEKSANGKGKAKAKGKGKGKGKGKETKSNEDNEPKDKAKAKKKGKAKAKGKENKDNEDNESKGKGKGKKTKASSKTDKTSKSQVSTEKSPSPPASPIIVRKRSAPEEDEGSASKKRQLSSESGIARSNEGLNIGNAKSENNWAAKEQSPTLSTVSTGSHKRSAPKSDEGSPSKKRQLSTESAIARSNEHYNINSTGNENNRSSKEQSPTLSTGSTGSRKRSAPESDEDSPSKKRS